VVFGLPYKILDHFNCIYCTNVRETEYCLVICFRLMKRITRTQKLLNFLRNEKKRNFFRSNGCLNANHKEKIALNVRICFKKVITCNQSGILTCMQALLYNNLTIAVFIFIALSNLSAATPL
jgi:hypothetical protein